MKRLLPRISIWLLLACAACDAPEEQPPPPPPIVALQSFRIEVMRTLPHDTTAYTQGLVFHEGRLYESTGRYGESSVRVLDPKDGRVVEREASPANVFAEGLARTGEHLVQLSWKEGTAFYLDPQTLEPVKTAAYTGEGWGLCYDGQDLYMTTGGDELVRRDARTFELLSTIPITRAGLRVAYANELECVGAHVWANLYLTTKLVRIDKRTGAINGEVDIASLVPPGIDRADADRVPNGIAYDAGSDTFYLTGKLWPVLLEVKLVPESE